MNKRKLTFCLAVGLVSIPFVVHADTNTTSSQPGSVDDPVITKSYFDQNIKQKVADELGKQSITEDKVKQLIAAELAKQPSGGGTPSSSGSSGNTGTSSPSTTPAVSPSNLTILKLEQGQTLYGGQGTEFIVRTGKAQVFSTDDNGVADVTSGKDIAAGQTAELNHLLIVPREGRGLKPVAKQKDDIYIMVRGNYLLMNADGTKVTS
ncbi:hypothetical protein O9H85_21045 [Paenibacillus filicis]|uniref:Uncharacterized protein n=1 Tax=Paenibacillus gyeongsangnamensis TaxID=3388067 RepID=A0ABT4QDC5_9BACL|nr:hypothetical protein [Paenibacillus filicis]MCZ8514860.1 hypothetical protein [Paenibacillus filicis]